MRLRSVLSFLGLAVMLPGANVVSVAAMAPSSSYEQIYISYCSVCHGDHGDGQSRAQTGLNPPPRNFTSPQAVRELSRERMLHSVTFGRPGTAMVPWGTRLSPEEIAGVVDFIRGRFMQNAAGVRGGSASSSGPASPANPSPAKSSPAKPEANLSASGSAADKSKGAAIFRTHCSTCHGDKGAGTSWAAGSLNPAPRDFTAPAARSELTLQRMLSSVTNGRPGTAMMAFGSRLHADEIRAVVEYIRSEFMGLHEGVSEKAGGETVPSYPAHHPAPVAVDMSAAFAQGLRGDARRGEAFYMQNCYACHGKNGDGQGPRASFIQPSPRDFLAQDSRQRFNRPALYTAIANGKRGTVMPAWKTVLDEQQIADVAEFVFTAFVHPPVDGGTKKKVN
ncbi:MAG: c-type cytochrome [Chromatiales bacterium]|nr:c-type cytochrome [Chromatiales bacterium]